MKTTSSVDTETELLIEDVLICNSDHEITKTPFRAHLFNWRVLRVIRDSDKNGDKYLHIQFQMLS